MFRLSLSHLQGFLNVLKNYTVFKNRKWIQLLFLNSDSDKMHGVFRINSLSAQLILTYRKRHCGSQRDKFTFFSHIYCGSSSLWI